MSTRFDLTTVPTSRPLARRALTVLAGVGLAIATSLAGVPASAAGPYSITGTVTAAGSATPLPGITVRAYQCAGVSCTAVSVEVAVTGDDGSYTLGGLEAGDYTLGFFDGSGARATEYWDDVSLLSNATLFAVGDAEPVDPKNADLAPGRRISGIARLPGGAALKGVEVSAYPSQPVDGEQVVVEFDETDEQGRYEIRRLPAGVYRIGFEWEGAGGYSTEYWSDETDLALADDIGVQAGDVDGIDVVLGAPDREPPAAVANTAAPRIRGAARVGEKLTATRGSWSPAPVTLTYQWLAKGKPIRGATGRVLKVKRGQLGKRITVRVTATASGRPATTVTSAPTKKVKAAR
ncbi:hypothetical protein [Nocardioides sp.]|uniref:MSCRAMM family protein n=1 Tax=Nocardioides sp. TaxID=35761 RepID=UPI001A2B6DBD|nr:hypothetical protein [Nocardioides sp.]MBJ7357903.1 hypothetical protein [Nocardioides sp.]